MGNVKISYMDDTFEVVPLDGHVRVEVDAAPPIGPFSRIFEAGGATGVELTDDDPVERVMDDPQVYDPSVAPEGAYKVLPPAPEEEEPEKKPEPKPSSSSARSSLSSSSSKSSGSSKSSK